MAYIYCADTYCDSCGESICKTLDVKGERPANVGDHYSYDSDEYPKDVGEIGETDGPQHCGSHTDCLEMDVMPNGEKVSALLGTDLTDYGIHHLREMVAEGGPVADFWRTQFDWIDFSTEVTK